MNIREVEALLKEIANNVFIPTTEMDMRIAKAIVWCKSQQKAAATRKAHFKYHADEQRELLR